MDKEQKAKEYAIARYGSNDERNETQYEMAKVVACRVGFEKGWDEALKSQWISTEERLPELHKKVLVFTRMVTGMSVCIMKRIPHDSSNPNNGEWHWSLTNYKEDVLAWMPIPSFNQILKANKDVLMRLKDR